MSRSSAAKAERKQGEDDVRYHDSLALQEQFADKLVVVGVTSETEATLETIGESKIEFASALDLQGKLNATAEVTSIPCVLLLDARGIVRYHGHPDALTPKRLQSFLTEPAD